MVQGGGLCLLGPRVGGDPKGIWGGGWWGDLGLPSISSAQEQGVAVENGANNSSKTTHG